MYRAMVQIQSFVLCFGVLLLFSGLGEQVSVSAGCVCPGIQRPVCTWNNYGNAVINYENLCRAKCSSKKGRPMGIIPGSICREIKKGNATFLDPKSQVYLTSWFEEMEKEAAINEEVDKKMTELLDLAGGVMSGPNKDKGCICPALSRPLHSFGPSGKELKMENLCEVKCHSLSSEFEFQIFPWRKYKRNNTLLFDFEDDARENFDYYLNKWYEDMDREIVFYRKVENIMSRIIGTTGCKGKGHGKVSLSMSKPDPDVTKKEETTPHAHHSGTMPDSRTVWLQFGSTRNRKG